MRPDNLLVDAFTARYDTERNLELDILETGEMRMSGSAEELGANPELKKAYFGTDVLSRTMHTGCPVLQSSN